LTLILIRFSEIFPDLIFKGGTCLNKVYFPYFRLSEDLDFVVSFSGGRVSRKTLLKKYENNISTELAKLSLKSTKIEKLDDYKIARYIYTYNSCIDESAQTIIFDISLKSQLQLAPYMGEIKSLYKDKILEESIFAIHTIACIDLKEALAEKIRAALTRKTPAIRDFFDIWYVKSQ
jgi:predicted nucleotidyltransferase component of viral defense system